MYNNIDFIYLIKKYTFNNNNNIVTFQSYSIKNLATVLTDRYVAFWRLNTGTS